MRDLPIQSSLTSPFPSIADGGITTPKQGIIIEVRQADHPKNRSAQQYQDFRGTMAECTVFLVDAGNIIEHVIITPDMASGMDDFYEKFPRAASQNVKGDSYSVNKWVNVDPADLDGDWCVVDFLNGRSMSPYIQRWWPNPRNFFDPATSGKGNPIIGSNEGKALKQEGRYFRRINGVEEVITKGGDVFFSTALAGYKLRSDNQGKNTDRVNREKVEDGGSILVKVKEGERLDLTWDDHPDGVGPGLSYSEDMPQKNPNPIGALPKLQSNTLITVDKSSADFKVPVNFTVEADKILRAVGTVKVEIEGTSIRLGDNATSPVALATYVLAAIQRLEAAVLAINSAAPALGATPAQGTAFTSATATAVGPITATPTLTVAATKVTAE